MFGDPTQPAPSTLPVYEVSGDRPWSHEFLRTRSPPSSSPLELHSGGATRPPQESLAGVGAQARRALRIVDDLLTLRCTSRW